MICPYSSPVDVGGEGVDDNAIRAEGLSEVVNILMGMALKRRRES